MLTHFIHKPESLKQARDEFNAEALNDDPAASLYHLDINVSLKVMMKLEYLNRVMCEALRFESPKVTTSAIVLLESVQLGDFNFAKGDVIQNFLHGLHHNENEW